MTRLRLIDLAYQDAVACLNSRESDEKSGTFADAKAARERLGRAAQRLVIEARYLTPSLGFCRVCNASIGFDAGAYYHEHDCRARHLSQWLEDVPRIAHSPARMLLERELESARNTGD